MNLIEKNIRNQFYKSTTTTFDRDVQKYDSILFKVNEAKTNLLNIGYKEEDIHIFMSKDVMIDIAYFYDIISGFVENPLVEKRYLGCLVCVVEGKNVIYVGIKIEEE